MQLHNEFVVAAPVEQAWTILTDLELVATCLPGASLDGRDGDAYVGGVTIKVGPIAASFHGTARFVEQDDEARAATIVAAGKDPRGQAAANATIRARVEPDGPSRSRVLVETDLDVSGRMAQFGRGVMADVSARLMNQFADNLSGLIEVLHEEDAAGSPRAGAAGDRKARPTGGRAPVGYGTTPGRAEAGLDVLSLIGPVVLRRIGPVLAVVVAGAALARWWRRGSRRRR
ncbi:MAG: carbon monoxide dehydrogenase protein [Blastococcus sp.]|jgi:carbon monoxide dehydrogenase subunit G|nr:carbon monoxide dehydrogenase protein [Blastococcus sp.]